MSQQRPNKHRNRDKGVDQFKGSLPSDKNYDHLFMPVAIDYDYGVDGITQVFKGELHTGEFYLVQVKAKEEVTVTRRGVVTCALKMEKAEFYIEQLKEPLVFILCDLNNTVTYWHDIQTNEKTLNLYKIAKDKRANYLNIEIDPTYILPVTFNKYCEYIHLASEKLNKREETKRLATLSLTSAIEEINSYEGDTMSLKGYDVFQGKDLTPEMKKKLVFSTINKQTGKTIHYLANNEYTKQNVIKIKTAFAFPKTTEGTKLFKELKEVLKNKRDFVNISGQYIQDLTSFTDTRTINESKSGEYSIRIGVPVTELELHFRDITTDNEVRIRLNSWLSQNKHIKMDSSLFVNQPLMVTLSLNLTNNKLSVSYKLNLDKLNNVGDAFFYINFLENFKTNGEIFAYNNGIKRVFAKIKNLSNDKSINNDPHFILLEKLSFIQEKTTSLIKYPFPEKINREEMEAIEMIYEMLKFGKSKISVNFKVKQTYTLNVGDPLTITQQFENYTIFNTRINLPNKNVKIVGKINNILKENNLYNIQIMNADMSFEL